MIKKFIAALFIITFLLFTAGFSDIKQRNDYTCAPVCAANCIINYGLNNKNNLSDDITVQNLVNYFAKQAKTTTKGTKANNLCKAIEKYFRQNKRIVTIKYDGIRPVDKKFKTQSPLDIKQELQNGKSVIVNIGVYKTEAATYQRQYGHYVNVIDINEQGQLLVSDPYYQGSAYYVEITPIQTPKIIHNKNDNERVVKNNFKYQKITGIPYLEKDESALLNGIISIYLEVF